MIPESKYIKKEITIREMGLNEEVKLTRGSLVRWVALSLGLISPNESRKLLIDLLDVLFEFFAKGEEPTTKEILEALEKKKKSEVNAKAVYYHLQKLKDRGLLQREKGKYFISREQGKLSEALKGIYMRDVESAFSNIEKALRALEK